MTSTGAGAGEGSAGASEAPSADLTGVALSQCSVDGVRSARPADISVLVSLVRELADYERSADAVCLTESALAAALFAPSPRVHAAVAEADSGAVVGFALWFVTFSTWLGQHGLYLEDLYVRPEVRGRGHGRALLAHLAARCVRDGYGRLEWAVLDWNIPAHEFYRSLGGQPQNEWTTWRLTGDALATCASTVKN